MTPGNTQHCTQCGVKLPSSARFCNACGTPTVPTAALPASAATPPAAADMANFTRVRQLFDQAQDIPADQRDAWLVTACQGDAALLAELRGMLTAGPYTSFMEKPAASVLLQQPPAPSLPFSQYPSPASSHSTGLPGLGAPTPSAPSDPSGSFIGPYRILRELGRGGMGVVYLAMRDDGAFRKNVAIKLLLREQVTPEFVERFKAERQVVAALDHANIARILDGGDARDGMPYYVMEYVEGTPLDQYCDTQRLSLTGRIQIFQQVCHAVHYLHQNLIVHRDLKPSNILVSTEGVVKLLDFGIAKQVGAASLASQELTGVHAAPMTPIYASPEQMSPGGKLQHTSDIFSLGVILYKLLTGRQPYAGVEDKMMKLAARIDPPLASQNIREDLRVSSETTAQRRRAMIGAIDSIVLMAMRYDPKQRYQSADDLASDLQNFLDGEALKAYREPVAVRSFKILKRKRALIAALVGFLVLGGFGAWQWQRAEQQKQETERERREVARKQAEADQRQAQLRSMLEQLEIHAATATDGAPRAQDVEDVRKMRKAFESEFTSAVAMHPGKSAERDALMERGVKYFDKYKTAAAANPELALEVAESYQQLGILQASTGRDPQEAVLTYRKAIDVLNAVIAATPNNAVVQYAAKNRLANINQLMAKLGEKVVPPPRPEPEKTVVVEPKKTPQSKDTTKTDSPPRKPTPPDNPNPPVTKEPPSTPPPQPPAVVVPTVNNAEMRALETRLIDVQSQVAATDQMIEPLRKSLAANGQMLNASLSSTLANMHAMLDRARNAMSAGDLAGAREDMDSVMALSAKARRAVGR